MVAGTPLHTTLAPHGFNEYQALELEQVTTVCAGAARPERTKFVSLLLLLNRSTRSEWCKKSADISYCSSSCLLCSAILTGPIWRLPQASCVKTFTFQLPHMELVQVSPGDCTGDFCIGSCARCSDSVLSAGIFFPGYALFQIPSNLILVRVGAPLWLSCMLALW